MAVTFLAMVIAMVPTLSVSVPMLSPELAAKLATVGGTNNPSAKHVESLVGGSLVDGRTIEAIYTPQQFWPVNGPLTLHESVMEGRDNVLAWAVVETDQDVTLLTISQGAVVLSQVIARWNNDPESAPPAHQFRFVLLANPMRPNGGALSRLPGLSVLGINFYGPTEESQYEVIDSAFAYDLFSTAPMYLNNPLSLLNAIAGIAFPYNGGNPLHGTDPDWTNPDLDVRTVVHGNTTYHTIIPKNLPLLEPLRMVGLGTFADVIQPVLKVWVDAGYYKNDPAASPGVHMAVQLFMPLENIIRALVQTPVAILDGLATIPHNLGLVPNRPQSSQTEDPLVVDGSNGGPEGSIDNRVTSTSSSIMPEPSDNKKGDKVVTDSPEPDTFVATDSRVGNEPEGSNEPPQTPESPAVMGDEEEGRNVPDQKPSTTLDMQLGNEGSEPTASPAPSRNETNDDDDDSLSLSSTDFRKDGQERVFKKGGKKFGRFDSKDDKEDKDSLGSKLTTRSAKPETASSSKKDDAGNDRSPSGSPSAGGEGNDKADAA